MQKEELIERFVGSIEWIRKALLEMDSLARPVMGIKDWDDSCCIEFGGKKLLVSVDGPYTKRLVMKSALIHASTDVIVKGGKPLFAMDTLIGQQHDLEEMVESLKKQSLAMKIPILGGNTMYENEEPRCSLAVVGELLPEEPIRDSTARKGDILLLLGEPIWGEQDERVGKAKILFKTWFEILKGGIEIHASKDVTKGGLIATLYEMEQKSGLKFTVEKDIPVSMTRNLDNFLVAVSPEAYEKIKDIAEKNKCSLYKIGSIK